MMYKISDSRINDLFAALNSEMALYLPVEANGTVQFAPWVPDAAVRLDALNTAMSPKGLFFPHVENIAAFKVQKKEITIDNAPTHNEPFAVFGVRACDAQSLSLLDRVFLSEPVDTFYEARRRNGVVITAACFRPEESCFCGTFDIDATAPSGDIATWFADGTLYWLGLTERGYELTKKIEEFLFPIADEDETTLTKHKTKSKDIFTKLPFSDLNLKGFTPEKLMEKFNSAKWQELYPTCLACGTCTFVCPTCHCYDIQDTGTDGNISRKRCWDSCMYSDFTLMAHGNPRMSQLERFRQRFMHKLIYFPENNDGQYACTGCGRCVKKCPVSMNIAKVSKALEDGENVYC